MRSFWGLGIGHRHLFGPSVYEGNNPWSPNPFRSQTTEDAAQETADKSGNDEVELSGTQSDTGELTLEEREDEEIDTTDDVHDRHESSDEEDMDDVERWHMFPEDY